MRNLILYFTATGNTERLVGILGQTLEKSGESPLTRYIRADTPPLTVNDVAEIDRIIICFPVLAMQAPVLIKRFVRELPPGKNRGGQAIKAAVIANAGDDAGPAADIVAESLARRGYAITLIDQVIYPANWSQVGMAVSDQAEIEQGLAKGDQASRLIAERLVNAEIYLPWRKWGTRLFGRVLGFFFGTIGRRFLGKLYSADLNCTVCGICAKTCPANAISMGKSGKERPYWRFNCQDCGRCINICPQKSINLSIAQTLLILLTITGLSIAGILASEYIAKSLFAWTGIATRLLEAFLIAFCVIGAHIAAIGPIDYFLFRPLRAVRGVRRLFAFSFTKRAARYTAPGFRPLH